MKTSSKSTILLLQFGFNLASVRLQADNEDATRKRVLMSCLLRKQNGIEPIPSFKSSVKEKLLTKISMSVRVTNGRIQLMLSLMNLQPFVQSRYVRNNWLRRIVQPQRPVAGRLRHVLAMLRRNALKLRSD